jgi:hypothetical protein
MNNTESALLFVLLALSVGVFVYYCTWYDALRRRKAPATLHVLDSEENRRSTFWCKYIGKKAYCSGVGADGLLDIVLEDGNPVQGVGRERFDLGIKP